MDWRLTGGRGGSEELKAQRAVVSAPVICRDNIGLNRPRERSANQCTPQYIFHCTNRLCTAS